MSVACVLCPSPTSSDDLECSLDADDVLDRRSRLGMHPELRARAAPAVTALVDKALHGLLG